MAGIDSYRANLRSVTRGYWSGVLDLNQFYDQMRATMNTRLQQAWDEGAAECGIRPDEYTPEEQIALANGIANELNQLPGLALRVDQNSKVNKGKLTPLLDRVSSLWLDRYNDFKNRARLMACKDQKLEWIYGDTEHCTTCAALNGKVKRGSFWQTSGYQPQNPPNSALECGGWRCQCRLEPTDRAISKGPLPNV